MNTRQLFEVLCKALGLYLLFHTFLSVKEILIVLATMGSKIDEYLPFVAGQLVLTLGAYLFGAWFMISKSMWIATRMMGPGELVAFHPSRREILSGVIVFIGLLSMVQAIPEIVGKLSHFIYFNDFDREDRQMFWDRNQRKENLVFAVVKLAVGLLVLANHKSIVSWLDRQKEEKQGTLPHDRL
jgi:hypothetical protein